MRHYRQLSRVGLQEWKLLGLAVGLTAIAALAAVAKPWPIKILADFALGQDQSPDSTSALFGFGPTVEPWKIILQAAGASLGVAALLAVLDSGLAWVWTVLGQRVARRLSADLFRRILHLPLSLFRRFTIGDLLSRLSTDTAALAKLMNGLLITPATSLFTVGITMAVAWRLDRELAAWCFATAPLMAIATVAFGKPIRRRHRRSREAQGRLASFVQQTLAAMPLVQVFDTGDRNARQLASLAQEATTLTKQGLILARSQAFVTGLISVAGSAVIIYIGGRKALSGAITVGTFLVFIAYLQTAQRALESLLKLYGSFQPLIVGLERVCELLQPRSDEVAESAGARPLHLPGKRPPSIRFERITFGYETGRPVLHDFSLDVEPGESVALVGASGSGKSTILSLIPRLYDLWSGRLLIADADIREVTLASLRGHISTLFQQPYLLQRTVAENIAYARPEASRAAVTEAAVRAQADGFIRRMPGGYDALLGQDGATVSGGEKQRLAMARAYLHDGPVLLLDEPTSACDGATEHELIEGLQALARNKTVLIAAHRLSSISWVDRIVVLDQGRIVEEGSHDELMRAGGRYHRFDRLQRNPAGREAWA